MSKPTTRQPVINEWGGGSRTGTHLGQVDRRNLVLVEELRAVGDDNAAQVPLLSSRGLVGALRQREPNESLDKELTGEALLAILRYALEDDGCRGARLDGRDPLNLYTVRKLELELTKFLKDKC